MFFDVLITFRRCSAQHHMDVLNFPCNTIPPKSRSGLSVMSCCFSLLSLSLNIASRHLMIDPSLVCEHQVCSLCSPGNQDAKRATPFLGVSLFLGISLATFVDENGPHATTANKNAACSTGTTGTLADLAVYTWQDQIGQVLENTSSSTYCNYSGPTKHPSTVFG